MGGGNFHRNHRDDVTVIWGGGVFGRPVTILVIENERGRPGEELVVHSVEGLVDGAVKDLACEVDPPGVHVEADRQGRRHIPLAAFVYQFAPPLSLFPKPSKIVFRSCCSLVTEPWTVTFTTG